METSPVKKREQTLTSLFWHYLLAVGGTLICILGLSLVLFWMALASGLVLPANTAEAQVREVEEALSNGTMALSEVPYYFRWACLDESGQVTAHSGLTHRRQAQIREAAEVQAPVTAAFPYGQYYRYVTLLDGRSCVLQYDFSMPYATENMQSALPEWQLFMIFLTLVLAVLATLVWTKRYARILQRDAGALTGATQAILEQRLDAPFGNDTHVHEFSKTLQAMDLLRSTLAESLRERWAMEQQRTREITALTHDLKTPLTVISGNGELLAEDALSEQQRKSVEAILRSAQRMESYLGQLRAAVVQQNQPVMRETVPLHDLFAEWVHMGEELCGGKEIRFQAAEPPSAVCSVETERVNRAVLNILDNAVRYTPKGGEIVLSADIDGGFLSVVIQDGGPGFTKEAAVHGCDFFYTDNVGRQGEGHMGMGLYYAQCVAQSHQGAVVISNTKAGGTVTLRLKISP